MSKIKQFFSVCAQVIGFSMHKYFTECAWSIAQQTSSAQCICSYVSLLALGVSVSTPDGEKVGRAILLQASLNLPARAIVLNMKQHNGRFACIYTHSPDFVFTVVASIFVKQ